MRPKTAKLLSKPKVVEWCYRGVTKITLADTQSEKSLAKYKEAEKLWGNKTMGTNGSGQWTTALCQNLAKEALTLLGRKNVRVAIPMKSSVNDKRYMPDLECDDFVYEIKGRNWTTTGTAGEKALGVLLKYGEVPEVYKKPLKIILVGYQEYEIKNGYGCGDLLDPKKQTSALRGSLDFYRKRGIEYLAFTDILQKIGYTFNSKELR